MSRAPRPSQQTGSQTRWRVAVEAARLISEHGLRDYRMAKEKAAAQLGLTDSRSLPNNSEVEQALREHQRLFGGEGHGRHLDELRKQAHQAMTFLAAFEPRLVGAVLDGTADQHSAICLQLYTDQPQAVMVLLDEHGITHEESSRRLRLDHVTSREFPVLRFIAGDTGIDLTVLPYDLLRQAPLDRVTEKPMQRATLAMLDGLIGRTSD